MSGCGTPGELVVEGVEAPREYTIRAELRGAGRLAEVMGVAAAEQYFADKVAMEEENSRIAHERYPNRDFSRLADHMSRRARAQIS